MMKKPLIGIAANLSYVDMGNRGWWCTGDPAKSSGCSIAGTSG